MGLGGATKKLQKVADMGDELYSKINELRDQVLEMRATVQHTHERVQTLENKVDQQGAVIEALAEQEGIDVDTIHTQVAIEEAESAVTEAEGDGGASEVGGPDETTETDGQADDTIGDAEDRA
ncbi:hypothetical protein HWV07_04780 [Natronomonas salina]|uniref:DUF5798 family protein n=1 Tax=Natronomonas salina TaxID=1710540 RepID=UPI0015B4F2BD|nr:DUF5798 family protein [Natronomonas salina]QLD88382.1 hypothetical protein HWV07_04780 [Natronomonas salina]